MFNQSFFSVDVFSIKNMGFPSSDLAFHITTINQPASDGESSDQQSLLDGHAWFVFP
jgi:hypothetical protein